jgi:hypothetical protein
MRDPAPHILIVDDDPTVIHGRNAPDVTSFHHVNGIHDQVRSCPGSPAEIFIWVLPR